MFGCKHTFGKVEDGYQYCTKCGTAQAAPCRHEWKIIGRKEGPATHANLCECQICGELKTTQTEY